MAFVSSRVPIFWNCVSDMIDSCVFQSTLCLFVICLTTMLFFIVGVVRVFHAISFLYFYISTSITNILADALIYHQQINFLWKYKQNFRFLWRFILIAFIEQNIFVLFCFIARHENRMTNWYMQYLNVWRWSQMSFLLWNWLTFLTRKTVWSLTEYLFILISTPFAWPFQKTIFTFE